MDIINKLNCKRIDEKIQKIIIITMLLLLPILPIELTTIEGSKVIGKLIVRLVFALSSIYIGYILIISNRLEMKVKRVIWLYIMFVILIGITSYLTNGVEATKNTFKTALVFNTFIAFSQIDYSKVGFEIFIFDLVFIFYITIVFIDYISLGYIPKFYEYFFHNSNTLGMVALLMIYISLIMHSITLKKRYLIYPLGFLIIIIWSGSRTSLLALSATITTFLIWRLINKNKRYYYYYFTLIMLIVITTTVIYPYLSKLNIINILDEKILYYTNKSLFTGRQKLWLDAINLIYKKPLLGYGMNITLEELTGGDLTVHNVYLHLLLQGGLILLSVFIYLITWIWKSFRTKNDIELVRVGASCFIGILIMGIFELSLFDQIIPIGIIQWLIIGIGISPALYLKGNTDFKEMN